MLPFAYSVSSLFQSQKEYQTKGESLHVYIPRALPYFGHHCVCHDDVQGKQNDQRLNCVNNVSLSGNQMYFLTRFPLRGKHGICCQLWAWMNRVGNKQLIGLRRRQGEPRVGSGVSERRKADGQ